jgi:uroporphyrinogen decarboxylase
MGKMSPRERVLAAVAHKEPDRVPINFGGEICTCIVESEPDGRIYTRLCQALDIWDRPTPTTSEFLNIVVNIDVRVQDALHSDMTTFYCRIPPARVEEDGTKTWDKFLGIRIKRMGYYDEFFDFPMRNMTEPREIKDYPYWPDTKDPYYTDGVRDAAKKLRESTDRTITGASTFSALPFNFYPFLTGMDRWFMDMKLNEKFYFALSDRLLEIGTDLQARWLAEVGEYLDFVSIYDDLGSQQGLLMSHEDYRKFIHPYTKQIIENIKKYAPNVKIYRHACGSCYHVMKDFIELGIDVVHPVQPQARYNEPWRLKKEFGKDITLCGGIDIQTWLPKATPQQVKEEVKKVIEVYAPEGGFIIAPTHNIEPDTPPENIIAAFDAALEYGDYHH